MPDGSTDEPALRLGLSVPVEGMAGLPAIARRAESLGWTDAWSSESRGHDAFSPLVAVAAVTERMRLGSAIVAAFLRPPGVTAMHAATLANLAPGRFVLGLGASTRVVVEQWHGVPFPEQPLRLLRERATQIAALVGGQRVAGLRLEQPAEVAVPIYLAALGPRMLALTRDIASGVVLYLVGPRHLPEVLSPLGAGRDSVARIMVFPGSFKEAAVQARRAILPYTLVPYYARSLRAQGFNDELDRIGECWAAGDRAGAPQQVSDAMVRELTLIGTADEIAEGIAGYRRAGLRTPVLAFPTTRSAEEHLDALAPRT